MLSLPREEGLLLFDALLAIAYVRQQNLKSKLADCCDVFIKISKFEFFFKLGASTPRWEKVLQFFKICIVSQIFEAINFSILFTNK